MDGIKDRFSQLDTDTDGRVTREEYEHMRNLFEKAENQLFTIKPGGQGDIGGWPHLHRLQHGIVFVLAAGDTFTVLARNQIGEQILATPAVLDGCIYLRTEKHVFL